MTTNCISVRLGRSITRSRRQRSTAGRIGSKLNIEERKVTDMFASDELIRP